MTRGRTLCRYGWLDRMEYAAAWRLQHHLAAERSADRIEDRLLLLEHPPTFTLGKRTAPSHFLVAPEVIRERGAAVFEVDRGGDVTFHGPGQLVGYPIISLAGRQGGVGRYLRDLEAALIGALEDLGAQAGRAAGLTGVWVGNEKIAAIGARINARRVTSHGFALNVTTDLSYFEWIVPCGIPDRGVTSLQKLLGRSISFQDVIAPVVRSFGKVFDFEMEAAPPGLLTQGMAP